MKGLRGLWAVLALSLATPALPMEPNMKGMRVWSVPGFTIYSHDASMVKRLIGRTAAIEKLVSTLLDRKDFTDGNPLHVVILRDSVWHWYVRRNELSISEFLQARFADYIVIPETTEFTALDRSVDQEFTHVALRKLYRGHVPFWFHTGVGEYVGASQLLRDTVKLGLTEYDYGEGWVPVERLLDAEQHLAGYTREQRLSFHHQAWAMAHKGFHEPQFGGQIAAYIAALNEGLPIDQAVQRGFGMSVPELDKVVLNYARRRDFMASRIPFAWPARPTLGEGRKLSESEGVELLLRVMAETGARPEHLHEVADKLLKLAPGSANGVRQKFWIAIREPNEALAADRYSTLEPDTSDPLVARGVALALHQRIGRRLSNDALTTERRKELAGRALDLLARSERALPVDAEAAWAHGLLAAALKRDGEFALQRLELARATLPVNVDLAISAAMVHGSSGRHEEMQRALQVVAIHSRSLKQRQWARQLIAGGQAVGPGE